MAAGYLTAEAFPWLFNRLPKAGHDTGMLQAFQVGAQMKQRQNDNALRMREMEAKWKALDVESTLAQSKLAAQEQVAAGHAELGQILSEIGAKGDWSNPEAKSRFWGAAAKHPQLMKDPSFKELTQTFELADSAALRKQLLDAQIGGRMGLEDAKQENRIDILNARLDNLSKMKLDDQQFRVKFEELLQENRIERDKAKSTTAGDTRFDLNKSDEIALRSKLASLQTALNQGVLEMDEFEKKRNAVIEEYKAKARTPSTPAGTNAPAPAVKVFDPATGGFK